MEKKYYWLKLMKDFFTRPKIKKLRRIAGGDTYTIVYLKLQLLSLDNDGVLVYQHIEDDFVEEMALTIDEDSDNVAVTINYLISQGLIEQLSDNEYLMTETQYLIGSESSVAQRVRKHREQQKALQCNTDVTSCNAIETKCNVEIEKEKEKDIEIDNIKAKATHKFVKPTIEQVTDYCNERQNGINPQKFIDFYESKGWMIGKNKMKDWQACVRTWENKEVKKERHEAIPDYNKKNDIEISDELMAKYFGGN